MVKLEDKKCSSGLRHWNIFHVNRSLASVVDILIVFLEIKGNKSVKLIYVSVISTGTGIQRYTIIVEYFNWQVVFY